MNIVWVIVFAAIAIGAILYTRTVSHEAAERSGTVSFTRAIGAGVIGIGILLLAMPWAAGTIAGLDFVESSDFAVLTGAVYVLGILSVLAGLGGLLFKEQREA